MEYQSSADQVQLPPDKNPQGYLGLIQDVFLKRSNPFSEPEEHIRSRKDRLRAIQDDPRMQAELIEAVDQALDVIGARDPRLRQIVELRFNLSSPGLPMTTLAEVGQQIPKRSSSGEETGEIGITEERVGQQVRKFARLLRRASWKEPIYGFRA